MKSHIQLLGWLYILLSAVGLFAAGLLTFILLGAGILSGERQALGILLVVGTVIGSVLFLLSIPGLIAGIGLLQGRSWARVLTLILGVLHLIHFPLGTALGIYTLWVLLNPETERMMVAPAGA